MTKEQTLESLLVYSINSMQKTLLLIYNQIRYIHNISKKSNKKGKRNNTFTNNRILYLQNVIKLIEQI